MSRPVDLRVVVAAIVACLLLVVGTAHAAARITTPPGWSEGAAAQDEARRRATAWATASGYQLSTVMSTNAEDDFAETLAVLEIFEPLAEDAVSEADAARDVLLRVAGPVVDSAEPPANFTDEPTAVPGASIFRGSWEVGDLTFFCALAPSGPTQTLVVMAGRTREISLHTAAFESAVSSLDGITAPVTPFPRNTWRLGALIGWLVVAGVAFGAVAATADRSGDHARNSQRVALVLTPLAVVSAIVTYTLLVDRATALSLANVSREWMTIEISAIGFVLAAILWLAGRASSGAAVVRSAPTGGVYAGRTGPSVPRLYNPDTPAEPASAPPPPPPVTAVDLPEVGDVELEGHSHGGASLQPAGMNDDVDEDMKTRVAVVGVPGGKIEERRPRPAETFRHGTYSITKKDE